MRFTVVTYGTESDTRSLVGLCRGLLSPGHDVRLLADRCTLVTAQAQGVSAQALSGDMKATVGNFLLRNCYFEHNGKSIGLIGRLITKIPHAVRIDKCELSRVYASK